LFVRKRLLTAGALAVSGAIVAIPGAAIGQGTTPVERAAAFIATTQQPDGGFGGFGDGQTFDAIFALRAAGYDPDGAVNSGKTPTDFLEAKASAQDLPAEAGKAALAALALGLDPTDVAGTDLIAVIEDGFDSETGEYAADDFSQSVAILGLVCTENDVPSAAIDALREAQLDDGGWGFDGFSDPDTTAIALQALLAAGVDVDDEDAADAVAYFKATQASDGGWGFDPAESNASSTAYAVQALLAAGEPITTAAYEKVGVTPVEYLLSQQLADGSFAGFDPAFAANQVVPALAGRTFCDAPVTEITKELPPAPTPTATATATSTATATATPTQATSTPPASPTTAPKPPNTGSGSAGGETGGALPILLIAGVLAALGGAAAAMAKRR
jgi:hypothetical protein